MQQIFVFVIRNIFHVASTAYLRQKGQAQQIIGEITRDFEGVRVSQLEATFFEVLLVMGNYLYCLSLEIQKKLREIEDSKSGCRAIRCGESTAV